MRVFALLALSLLADAHLAGVHSDVPGIRSEQQRGGSEAHRRLRRLQTRYPGKVYRYSVAGWAVVPGLNAGGALNDIADTSPENLWVVGDNGKLFHWPK